MTGEHDPRVLLERVITIQEAHGQELCYLRADVKTLSEQVAQHRVGWKVFGLFGSACLVLGAALLGYWRS